MPSLVQSFAPLQTLPKIAMNTDHVRIHHDPQAFKQALLTHIRQAKRRIYITALYIEQDNAGEGVLDALYQAKQDDPALDIQVFVDFHRGQRLRIGEAQGRTNQMFYYQHAQKYKHPIGLHGVAIKSREMFGVLHLKGFVIDDVILYSGASINDVYMGEGERYRLDRYQEFHHQHLADAFVSWLQTYFIGSPSVHDFVQESIPNVKQFRRKLKKATQHIKKSAYSFEPTEPENTQIAVTPLMGLGLRKNALNKVILQLMAGAQKHLCLYTPYFNLPRVFATQVKRLLQNQTTVTIVVGDKTANDFYIPPSEPFSVVGAVPYVYEHYLRQFVRRHQVFIDTGILQIHIWKHAANSFHLKGVSADGMFHLLTGSNLNPRARVLDIENGLLVHDPNQHLWPMFQEEHAQILAHTRLVKHFRELEVVSDYPEQVQRVLKRVFRLKANILLKRIL